MVLPSSAESTETVTVSGAKDASLNAMVSDASHTFLIDTILPLVDVGLDQTRSSQFTPVASASDARGITSYQWSKVSGRGAIVFDSEGALTTTITTTTSDTYVLRLTVTDTSGNSNYDEFTLVWANGGVSSGSSGGALVSFLNSLFSVSENLATNNAPALPLSQSLQQNTGIVFANPISEQLVLNQSSPIAQALPVFTNTPITAVAALQEPALFDVTALPASNTNPNSPIMMLIFSIVIGVTTGILFIIMRECIYKLKRLSKINKVKNT
jgi:hypothetical protein